MGVLIGDWAEVGIQRGMIPDKYMYNGDDYMIGSHLDSINSVCSHCRSNWNSLYFPLHE